MKRLIALCLVIVLCISITACGSKKSMLSGTYTNGSKFDPLTLTFKDNGTWIYNFEDCDIFEGTYEKSDDGWVGTLENGLILTIKKNSDETLTLVYMHNDYSFIVSPE